MDKVAYAVHTRTCTFLLDAEGLCHWIISRTGVLPTEIRGCVGAQFVACLHPELAGSLAGELVIGAAALFVKLDPETGKFMLMRSGPILHVEQRGAVRMVAPEGAVLSDDTLDLKGGPPLSVAPPAPPPSYVIRSRGGDTAPPPPSVAELMSYRLDGSLGGSRGGSLDYPHIETEELDVDPDPSVPSMKVHDGESTLTLTLPLFRPEAPRRVR